LVSEIKDVFYEESLTKQLWRECCLSIDFLVGLAGFEPTTFAQEQRDADPYGFL